MQFTKHAKKIVVLALFLVPFFAIGRADALTVEGEWIDRAHIRITKFEINRDDLSDEVIDIVDNELGGGEGALNKIKEYVNKMVGVYEDGNMGDSEDRWLLNTGCDGQGQQSGITFDGGNMVIDSNNAYINIPGIDCKKFLKNGVNLSLGKSERAQVYFVASSDGRSLARVDKNPDQEPPYVATPGNDKKYFSRKSGNCDVAVTLNEDLKKGDANQLTRASWQACTGDPRDVMVSGEVSDGGGGGEPPGNGGGAGSEPEPTCEKNNPGGFSWLFCGILEAVDNTIASIINQAYELLAVDNSLYDNPELQKSWAYFRNIASVLLIAVGLVMVIGQAIGRD